MYLSYSSNSKTRYAQNLPCRTSQQATAFFALFLLTPGHFHQKAQVTQQQVSKIEQGINCNIVTTMKREG